MKIKKLIFTLFLAMGLSAQMAYPMLRSLEHILKPNDKMETWAGRIGTSLFGLGQLLIRTMPKGWSVLPVAGKVACMVSGSLVSTMGFFGKMGKINSASGNNRYPSDRPLVYGVGELIADTGLQFSAHNSHSTYNWLQTAVGLGLMTAAYKKLPSIENLIKMGRDTLLRKVLIDMCYNCYAGNQIIDKNLLYIAGAALLLSSKEDIDSVYQAIGISKKQNNKYLEEDAIRFLQHEAASNNNRIGINVKQLELLKEEADKNKIRKTPFILRPYYAIKSCVYQDSIDKKLGCNFDAKISALSRCSKRELPAEMLVEIGKFYENKERVTVTSQEVTEQITPYVKSSSWEPEYKQNKQYTIPITLNGKDQSVPACLIVGQ
jgi:hypothetical protein